MKQSLQVLNLTDSHYNKCQL